jgi:hypothetical protein
LTKQILLHIWTKGNRDVELPYIRQAKWQIATDIKLIPVAAKPGAVRVIAIGERPPFLCDHALIKDVTNVASVKAALEWYIDDNGDSRVTTIEKWLSRLMGAEVKEIDYYEVRS